MIGQTIAHYRIVSRLGAGGMGEVYLAEDTHLNRTVALKFLPAGYSEDTTVLERFKREAQAAAALNHPNIITIHEVAMHGDRPYIVMEHVDGLPLNNYVARNKLSIGAILDLVIQIGDGLAKAHANDVVHRDLKPDNILVDEDGRPKILDFGLAIQGGVTRITKESSTLGTVYYMSPEQARGSNVDHRSDIFSLGTVLYELITHQLPYQGDHQAAVMQSITSIEPHPMSRFSRDVTPELERIVSKMLAKDVEERYQSAADLVADLKRVRRITDSMAETAVHPPVPSKRGGVVNILKFVIPVAAAVVALLIILKPFDVSITPDKIAEASGSSLAVMYFDNLAEPGDDKRTGEIVANLLITALSDNDRLRVVSSQRLYDILKDLDKEGARVVDRSTATQVATRAGARSMLLGGILSMDPMVVTWQLVDVASGDVKDSGRVDGRAGENVFAVVDRMTTDLHETLALPAESQAVSVAERTTSSAEAYRLYIEGMEFVWKNFKSDYNQRFKAALEIDSTLAMAAYQLAMPNNVILSQAERRGYAEQAMRHADKVPDRDRRMIHAIYAAYHGTTQDVIDELEALVARYPDDKEAWYFLGGVYWMRAGDPERALRATYKVSEIDPNFKLGYNQRAYIHLSLRQYQEALEAVDNYILISPDEPNPYDTRAEIYGEMGRVDDAIKWYARAAGMSESFGGARLSLADMYLVNGDEKKANAVYDAIERSPRPLFRAAGRMLRTNVLVYHGQLRAALAEFDRGIAADEADGYRGYYYYGKYISKGFALASLGEFEEAMRQVRRGNEIAATEEGPESVDYVISIEILAMAGEFDAADSLLAANKVDPDYVIVDKRVDESFCLGVIAYYRGDYDEACDAFDKWADYGPYFYDDYMRGRAYLAAGRATDAAGVYDLIAHSYPIERRESGFAATDVHYYAGRAYEAAGQYQKAVAAYEEFLGWCPNADPELTTIPDAKRRLEALRRGM